MIKLRPYQESVAPAVFKYMEENEDKNPCVAIPTGGGKTYIAADIIKHALIEWPKIEIVVLSHVKEILEQNHAALTRYLNIDIGLWSSGLSSNSQKQVTVAGIQTVYNKIDFFRDYDLVIIDEAHLIPVKGDGMYLTFLKGIGEHRRIGLTATPYRLGSGYIYGPTDETMFDDLIIDYTYMEAFNKLIEDGYLCKLRTMRTETTMNPEGVRTTAGDYNDKDLSDKFDRQEITNAIVKEIIKIGEKYNKWLIFAIDIEHAEHITERLLQSGVDAYIVHSKMSDSSRDEIIKMFKSGKLRAIVNVNILTTGFDAPDIDLICLLRPTKSPVIHVQSIGRGLRIHPSKDHTMVLDFAGNTERLGPINDVQIRKKRKSAEIVEPIVKTCPDCNAIHHPSVRVCDNCGHVFQFKSDLRWNSSGAEVVATTQVSWHDVTEVTYTKHIKPNTPNSVCVKYQCGLRQFREWICIEHPGYAGAKALQWLKRRWPFSLLVPEDIDSTEKLFEISDKLKKPKRIQIDETGKYPKIIKSEL